MIYYKTKNVIKLMICDQAVIETNWSSNWRNLGHNCDCISKLEAFRNSLDKLVFKLENYGNSEQILDWILIENRKLDGN